MEYFTVSDFFRPESRTYMKLKVQVYPFQRLLTKKKKKEFWDKRRPHVFALVESPTFFLATTSVTYPQAVLESQALSYRLTFPSFLILSPS